MDKETLSNYGWIVICVLILAVMLALASPFGNFVAGAIKSTTACFFNVNQNALNSTGLITLPDQEFEDPSATPQPPTEPEPVVAKAVRNERTLEEYDTVSEAIAKAQEGDILKLYKDVNDTSVFAMEYTIDLNGNDLTTTMVVFGDFKDSKDGRGSVSCTSGMAYMNDIKDYFPIYNEETDAYHFFKFSIENMGVNQERKDDKLEVDFNLKLAFTNNDAYKILETGSDLDFILKTEYFNTNGVSEFCMSETLNLFGTANKDGTGNKIVSMPSSTRRDVAGNTIKYSFIIKSRSTAVGMSNQYKFETPEYTFVAK